MFTAGPFWQNGPAPGSFYDFPNFGVQTKPTDFRQHSQAPVTTATSLVAVAYDKGVVMGGDLLASYGSLARYRNCPRIVKVNDNIVLGASGDYADFQYVKDFIEQKVITEECIDDGMSLKPKSLYCWLTRILYNRRSKMDPLWNNFIVAGVQDGEPFLGTVDKQGTAYTDKVICTGYGAHIATPLLRDTLDKNPQLNLADARALVQKCMEVLYYRDARSFPKYQLGVIDLENGVQIEGPLEVPENWGVAHSISGY
ncbi:proteasome subunit beta type-4 [Anthonomus grandis grandis]|uniref:proteasome subunit beta type-4 n=1 Tax=Anthonomus grandis grandis TaxID=2921223 RepID=UPI00216513D7|nr:proteasome subunit beta type-4 [Anthonomus grandis grandis]